MKRYAVIVAGGQGIRMKGSLPKQFLPLSGMPVLMHTLSRFHQPDVECILVMNQDYLDYWKEICNQYHFTMPHTLIAGGSTRAESVWNGIRDLEASGLVAIHDAVRPLVTAALIEKLFTEASEFGNAVPVVLVKDTLREVAENNSKTVPRERYRIVQTPQIFNTGILKEIFSISDFARFTDEASLYEAAGYQIHLVEGEEQNIKITVPSDLILAEAFLTKM